MKAVPALLCSLLAFGASAQPIQRCLDSAGEIVAYQDRACPEPPVAAAPAPLPAATPTPTPTPVDPVEMALFDGAADRQGGWTTQQRQQRRREAKIESRADDARTRMLLQPANERRHAEYALSNQRCQVARQVAALCGAAGRAFSCNEKGFRAEPLDDVDAPAPPGPVGRSQTLRREQCALQLTRGRD